MNTLRFVATAAFLLLSLGLVAAPFLPDIFAFALLDSLRLPVVLGILAGLAALWFPWRGAYMLGRYLLAYRNVGLRTLFILLITGALFMGTADAPTPSAPTAQYPDPGTLRFATLNTLYPRQDLAPKVDFARTIKADVLSIIEARPEWQKEMPGLTKLYPHQWYTEVSSSGYGYGMVLLSRFPVDRVAIHPTGRLVHYRVHTPPGTVHLVQVHPHSPFTPSRLYARNALLAELAALTPEVTGGYPLVIMGDFNTVPWQKNVKDLLRQQDLKLTGPATPTFPAINFLTPQDGVRVLPLTPIDYILVPEGARVTRSSTHRVEGTDHLGVSADMALPR